MYLHVLSSVEDKEAACNKIGVIAKNFSRDFIDKLYFYCIYMIYIPSTC